MCERDRERGKESDRSELDPGLNSAAITGHPENCRDRTADWEKQTTRVVGSIPRLIRMRRHKETGVVTEREQQPSPAPATPFPRPPTQNKHPHMELKQLRSQMWGWVKGKGTAAIKMWRSR
ncbi:hypothetical protein Q8A73_018007 [Channa argus]|nr:hypothetical protein Q8A73_018007 [Channa argus]